MKLKRGTFSATFFLACLAAMELEGVVLEEIKGLGEMLRVLAVLLALCGIAHSEEGSPTDNQHGGTPQQITIPANSATPTIININTGKHSGEESHCAQPKDWKEWGSFAWCRSLEGIDAERIIASWTVVLGLATSILGIATWKLWRSTDKLVAGAESTAKTQLRAYVAVCDVKILYADGEWQPNIRVTYQNYGKTPAHEVENRMDYFFQIAGTPSFKDLKQKDPRTMYLAPSQDRTTSLIIRQVDWILFKDAVAKKAVAVFVYGEIHYADAFGEPRWTRYRLQLAPDDEGIKEDSFVLCAEGNEAN